MLSYDLNVKLALMPLKGGEDAGLERKTWESRAPLPLTNSRGLKPGRRSNYPYKMRKSQEKLIGNLRYLTLGLNRNGFIRNYRSYMVIVAHALFDNP